MKTKFQANKMRRVLACVVMLASLLFISTLGSSYAQSEQPPTQEPAQADETGDEEMPLPTDTPSEPQPEPQDEPLRAPLPADAPIYTAGVDRYVATTGTDSGNCTASPCKTVAYAVSQAVSGDSIHIAAGTYPNTHVDSEHKDLIITGAGMNKTILDGGNTDRVFCSRNANYTLQDITIRNGFSTSYGGGILIYGGSLSILRVEIINNTAYDGGGLMVFGYLDMMNVFFSGNNANEPTSIGNGGGLYLYCFPEDNPCQIENVSFIDNHASGVGGGIHFEDGITYLNNVTVSGNSALAGGGLAAQNTGPIVAMLYVTISNNIASPGGIYNRADMDIKNSIIANNSLNNCGGDNLLGSFGHNLDSGHSCFIPYTGDLLDTDPLLLSLKKNGGLTPTHALPKDSPAVDAGDCDTRAPKDQRGHPRPQDGNNDGAAACDLGAYELDASRTFKSSGAYDGWVLESARTSSSGGSLNRTATTLRVGDDAQNRQYRAILHFNTASLPDNAVITSVKLQVKRAGYKGTYPFNTHGALYVDMRKGAFSNNNALQTADWQAAASKLAAGKIPKSSASNWHTLNLAASNLKYINKKGVTQLRLRFNKQDNGDNGADYVNFYSGNAGAANRPKLIITYYVP